MRLPPYGMIAVLGAACWGGSPSTSQACCNALPVISRDYQSTLGSVRERIVAPGNWVTITRKPCETTSGTLPPFFDPVAANNMVKIVFDPPGGGGGTTTTVGQSSEQCDGSGSCIICPMGSTYPCNTLRFRMPDTDADLPPIDGDGWAGPATITVTRGGITVAEVGPLYPPSDQCDCVGGQPPALCDPLREKDVFKQFTVLPAPNDLQELVGGLPLRVTVDGHGNLLVPLRHPASAYARPGFGNWERGQGTFCARSSGPVCPFNPKMTTLLAGAPPGSLQTFTISGQRVATILDHDADGALFGIADVDYSVLWIGKDVGFDVVPRMTSGNALVKINKSASLSSQFDLETCNQTELVSVRVAPAKVIATPSVLATPAVIAHVDGRRIVQVHELAKAGKDCGKDTGTAAEPVNLGGVVDAALEAGSSLVAFVSQGTSALKVFSADGKDLTSAQSPTAATNWSVNDHVLAVEESLPGDVSNDSLVYFYDPSGTLRTFNATTKKVEDVASATVSVVAGQRALTQAKTGTAKVHRYPWSTASTTDLNVTAAYLAMAPDLVAVADASGNALKVWSWAPGTGVPVTPPQTPPVVTNRPLGVTQACTGSGCSTRIVVNSLDPNGNHSLKFYDATTYALDDTQAAAEDFVAGERLVAFRTSEGKAGGGDLNGDGDTDDVVMRAVVFDGSGVPIVRKSGRSAVGWTDYDAPWATLGWRTPYKVVEDSVFFVTRECDQRGTNTTGCPKGGTDMTGDKDADDLVLLVFHPESSTLQPVAAVGAGPAQILLLPSGLSVRIASAAVSGGIAVGDGDQDGVLDAFDNCETTPNPRQFDDDRDGLGDRFCDPTYCTGFTPPAIPATSDLRQKDTIAPQLKSAIEYVNMRGKRSLDCLNSIAAGDLTGDPETLCRGSFVAEVENPPIAVADSGKMFRTRVSSALPGSARRPASDFAQKRYELKLLRTLGESVNAATRVAYGQVHKLDSDERKFQKTLGQQSLDHLEALIEAMGACLSSCKDRPAGDAAVSRCLGHIDAGTLVLPTDDTPARRIQDANNALLAVTKKGFEDGLLSKLDSCASDNRHEVSCPVCTNWRNAVEVIAKLYAPVTTPPVGLARAGRR